ncbi:hypothetical protein WJX73_008970 [Symbiochloris irregularis]|uniref:oligopeptidase A n=1 Tax=Symbiochloris irregularis TaxID=706552 RepID=A0AAW1P934_9CHLO
MSAVDSNPLLSEAYFPPFEAVKAEHVVPAIREVLANLSNGLDGLEAGVKPTWQGLVEPLERMTDQLSRTWGLVSHLKAVKDSPELRTAVEEVQPETVTIRSRLAQSKPLYEAFKALKEGPEWAKLPEARQRLVEHELRDFELGGVALEGEAKERFNAIQQQLSKLSLKFSNNLQDATKAFKRLATDKREVEGLPPSALGLAAQTARAEGHEDATPENGPWVFTLDLPSYMPVMTHAQNRALREEVYRASLTRASSGEGDNSPVIEEILALRLEKAQLLGYPNHAEVSMASKMATLDRAQGLLEELRQASIGGARQDLKDVQEHAASQGFKEELKHWDVSFWAERLREAKYDIRDEDLRPYFPLERVLDGLFALVEEIFDVKVESASKGEQGEQLDTWHPDVRVFRVLQDGRTKAWFYLDPYSRPSEKRGGAWMGGAVDQSRLLAKGSDALRLPAAYVICNQSPPVDGQPSLMTFREVETVFHEFGHALQHMLTQQHDVSVAGINGVEWDAVELPSQFMENWCYDRRTLMALAKHYKSGEQLPDELFEKIVAARTYRSGSMTLRQLNFASLDLALHSVYTPGEGSSVFTDQHLKEIAMQNSIMAPLPEDRFLCGFAHIFAGGYAAGYFSYKWAETLSADAFAAFEEAGLTDNKAKQSMGRRFRDTILALGGGRAPELVFRDFRGRDPSTEALLRHSGLIPAAAA